MRLAQHKSAYTQWVKNGKRYMSSYELFKVGMPIIELIETYPCKSKDELHAREGYYIRETDCVNKYIAGQTAAEYYIANKDKRNEYNKGYYQENQPRICEQKKGYRLENQAKICEQKKGYRLENQAKISDQKKGYREANKAILLEKGRLRSESMKRVERLTLFIDSHLRKVIELKK